MAQSPLEQDRNANQSSWPACFAMFIALLVELLELLNWRPTKVRHTARFRDDWRDHWPALRETEWHRDQIIASIAADLLAGRPVADCVIIVAPPEDYGQPCPKNPHDMMRRFHAATAWTFAPHKYVRRHVARIEKRARAAAASPLRRASRATSPAFSGGGLSAKGKSSLGEAGGGGAPRLRARDGGGCASPRGPPPIPIANCQLPIAPESTRFRGRSHLRPAPPQIGQTKRPPLRTAFP